ncbi:MAG TPA: arginine N-succinyltransferase [Candidatus Binataceae bacterium]|nr:arginine N-succinyltransferase [Candidatus Binataceae bacterium]
MEPHAPAFIIREARPADRRRLLRLARELDSINLPTDSAELAEMLERSARSFRGRIANRARAVYIFCAEERATRTIAGASMIIAKHGTPQSPHYYLEIDSDERYSARLRKMFRHTYLRLRHSMDGPTELGGLIVTRAMRHRPERIGKQLSWVRFLYIARHPRRFESRVLAEMMPPSLGDHGNVFWDHWGRRVTGLSFREADRLSIHDKEFIRALFPDSPLYTFLLPEEVRAAIGAVGPETRGAVRLLEQAGMKFLNHIDPFDGGPYYGAPTAELLPVRERRVVRLRVGEPDPARARLYLIAHDDARRGFRAVQAIAAPTAGEALVVPRGVIEALALKDDASADAVALPGTPAGVRAPADTDEPPGGGHLRADGRLEAAKADGESGTAASATAEVPQSDGHAHIASSAR